MKMIGFHSSTLAAAGYENGILRIEFLSGDLYRFTGVPARVFNELLVAHSAGRYFNRSIKGRYPSERLR